MSDFGVTLSDELVGRIAEALIAKLDERDRLATQEPEPWISASEAAIHIGCSVARIYDLTQAGKIACGRDGTRRYYQRSALDRYLRGGES
jgi:excisionase family DNA binding protein